MIEIHSTLCINIGDSYQTHRKVYLNDRAGKFENYCSIKCKLSTIEHLCMYYYGGITLGLMLSDHYVGIISKPRYRNGGNTLPQLCLGIQ